ncbi:MAG: hypothetical protein CMK89_08805 [Pseudomonadales bacterium]|nr:hypothetical protein [Pseudomonadales bacterium]
MTEPEEIDLRSGGRQERSRRTRKALRNALLNLLQIKPLEQIRIRELTSEAGVAYATYFRNYEDKNALLQDLLSDEINSLLAMTLPLFFSGNRLVSTQELCKHIWKRRDIWRALLMGGAAPALKAEYLRQALKIAGDQAGNDSWVPGDLAVSVSVSSLLEIMIWWLTHENPPSAEHMAVVVYRLAVAPVLTEENSLGVML